MNYALLIIDIIAEADERRKKALRKESVLSEKIRDGNLARVQLLADRYIKEKE